MARVVATIPTSGILRASVLKRKLETIDQPKKLSTATCRMALQKSQSTMARLGERFCHRAFLSERGESCMRRETVRTKTPTQERKPAKNELKGKDPTERA